MAKLKKLKLIYNPFSGDKSFKFNLDPVISIFQRAGFETHIFRGMENCDIDEHLKETAISGNVYETVAVSGGDGSLNIVVNAMLKYGIDAKLGIIPSGTANDFAAFLQIPNDADKAAEVIARGRFINSDAGVLQNHEKKYFINVCGAGHFTNISQNMDAEFKNTLGKLAYYLKGIEQAPGLVPIRLRITNSSSVYEERVYFFIVLNSGGTAGFTNLVRDASVTDGRFEFIAVREKPFFELAALIFGLLKGDYLNDPAVLFFRDNYIKIEPLDGQTNQRLLETDLDGELGPYLPAEIRNIPGAVKIIC